MKKITVITQPAKLENLKKRLVEAGVKGLTITNSEGYGIARRSVRAAKQEDTMVEFLPKVTLEAVVKDADAEAIIGIIIDTARTGRIGDGKIFVTEVSEAIRIRTGERGEEAL